MRPRELPAEDMEIAKARIAHARRASMRPRELPAEDDQAITRAHASTGVLQ